MTVKAVVLNCSAAATLDTELLYSIASARALGNDFLKIVVPEDSKEYIQLLKLLKSLKKQGKVQIYIPAREFFGTGKEGRYLKNKYPSLADFFKEDEANIIIKL